MSQHTPGPWRIARDTYGVERIWGPQDESVACAEGDGFIDDEERKANAQLIKAAPALLAACKAARACLASQAKYISDDCMAMGHSEDADKALRRAIDQAEGRE